MLTRCKTITERFCPPHRILLLRGGSGAMLAARECLGWRAGGPDVSLRVVSKLSAPPGEHGRTHGTQTRGNRQRSEEVMARAEESKVLAN